MKCPFCGAVDSRVMDSRTTNEGTAIRRRRECIACAKRFTTYETIEEKPLVVIKKDGRREIFNGNKILRGLVRAGEKRQIPLQVFEELVEETERELRSTLDQEVTSEKIGSTVLQKLREVDEVAYVRFASVYRHFQDIFSFQDELEEMSKGRD